MTDQQPTARAAVNEYVPSRDAVIAAARIALDEMNAKGWQSNPAYWVGRLESALAATLKAIGEGEMVQTQAPEPSLDDYAKASRIIQGLMPRGRRQ